MTPGRPERIAPIVVAGLTPAWQQIVRLPRLELGEVNRARDVVWCGSGKVLNVGWALATLGGAARTVSPVGGVMQSAIAAELADGGIPVEWVMSQTPTRVCTTLLDEETGQITELVENAGALSAAELIAYGAALREACQTCSPAVMVIAGSLPAGTPADCFVDWLPENPMALVLDVRGAVLQSLLPRKPWLVKPNRDELAETVGRPLTDDSDLLDAMRSLNAAGAEWVVVSQGSKQLWATSLVATYRVVPPRVAVVNPIGCGDSLAAGLALGKSRGWPIERCLAFGVAAASDNATRLLPARLDRPAVERLAEQTLVEQVNAS
jgi:tagatose 6-phosphate kinase